LNLRPSGYEKMSRYLRSTVRTSKNSGVISVSSTKRRRIVSGTVAAVVSAMLVLAILPQVFPNLKQEKGKSGERNGKVRGAEISRQRIAVLLRIHVDSQIPVGFRGK